MKIGTQVVKGASSKSVCNNAKLISADLRQKTYEMESTYL